MHLVIPYGIEKHEKLVAQLAKHYQKPKHVLLLWIAKIPSQARENIIFGLLVQKYSILLGVSKMATTG
jgi:hypothetical protein